MTRTVGLIGLGEAGSAIASGLLAQAGVTVVGYDVRASEPAERGRLDGLGVVVAESLGDLAASTDTIISLTSAKVAVPVAQALVGGLSEQHVYSDWNSTSPQRKREVAAVIEPSGARFADGAVLAAVPPHQHRVPVLLSGAGAAVLVERLAPYQMALENLGGEVGQASAVKMFRSLLVKGLEALLLECAIGASAYGATERVLTSMNGTLPTSDWNELAAYLLTRTLGHAERRAEELRQVAGTLEDVGVAPYLATAGAQRLQWVSDIGVRAVSAEAGIDYWATLAGIIDAAG